MCKCLLVEFYASTILEFIGLWGYDLDTCGETLGLIFVQFL